MSEASPQATLTIMFEDLQGSTALATSRGDIAWQEARRVHEKIVRQQEIRRFHAQMLLDRNDPGDQVRARELLTESVEGYLRVGMARHADMARALLNG